MAKPKIKIDVKDFFLRRGELLVMGMAGFCLIVLLGWGAAKWGTADNPTKIAEELNELAEKIRGYLDILASRTRLRTVLREELMEVKGGLYRQLWDKQNSSNNNSNNNNNSIHHHL